MVLLFGSEGIINPYTLIFAAVFVLGALVFRKTVANDSMGRGFSFIGASVGGILGYMIIDLSIGSLRYGVGLGLILWLVGGFLLADVIGDGEASG